MFLRLNFLSRNSFLTPLILFLEFLAKIYIIWDKMKFIIYRIF